MIAIHRSQDESNRLARTGRTGTESIAEVVTDMLSC